MSNLKNVSLGSWEEHLSPIFYIYTHNKSDNWKKQYRANSETEKIANRIGDTRGKGS